MTADRVYNVLFFCAGNSARPILSPDEPASLCPVSAMLLQREVES